MVALYPYVLTLHLFCAIFFVGYLFVEFLFFLPVLKQLPQEWGDRIRSLWGKIETRFIPLCLLVIILSGGMMVSRYLGGEDGYFNEPFQTLLTIKMFLGLSIFALILFSLFVHFVLKKGNPIGKLIHLIAFVLSLVIVLIAKIMFYI